MGKFCGDGKEDKIMGWVGTVGLFCRPAIDFIIAWIIVLMRTQFVQFVLQVDVIKRLKAVLNVLLLTIDLHAASDQCRG